MEFEAVPVGEPEQPHQIDRIAHEHLVVGNVDAVVVDDEVAGAGIFKIIGKCFDVAAQPNDH